MPSALRESASISTATTPHFLGRQATEVVRALAACGEAEIVADNSLTRGGCLIETQHGQIDARIETVLDRIVAELLESQDSLRAAHAIRRCLDQFRKVDGLRRRTTGIRDAFGRRTSQTPLAIRPERDDHANRRAHGFGRRISGPARSGLPYSSRTGALDRWVGRRLSRRRNAAFGLRRTGGRAARKPRDASAIGAPGRASETGCSDACSTVAAVFSTGCRRPPVPIAFRCLGK